jgi:hypothetical protein
LSSAGAVIEGRAGDGPRAGRDRTRWDAATGRFNPGSDERPQASRLAARATGARAVPPGEDPAARDCDGKARTGQAPPVETEGREPVTIHTYAPDPATCQGCWSGHHMHQIHASYLGRTPWGWRDAVVTAFGSRGTLEVTYLGDNGCAVVWHHRDLADLLRTGAPVRIHEQYHALGAPFGWLNVHVLSGLGSVPTPADTDRWNGLMTGGVVSLASGRGMALDHS